MSLFHRKTRTEKLLKTLESNEAVKTGALRAVEAAVTGRGATRRGHPLSHVIEAFESGGSKKAGPLAKVAKSGLAVTAGIAAVTAVSAGVASMRQKSAAAPEESAA
jgi:hypothetical protein